jgi:hypothetical protein
MSKIIINKVVEQLLGLPDDLQQEVLTYTQGLRNTASVGLPGKNLTQFAGSIPLDDLKTMHQVIEAGCEQVDLNEW